MALADGRGGGFCREDRADDDEGVRLPVLFVLLDVTAGRARGRSEPSLAHTEIELCVGAEVSGPAPWLGSQTTRRSAAVGRVGRGQVWSRATLSMERSWTCARRRTNGRQGSAEALRLPPWCAVAPISVELDPARRVNPTTACRLTSRSVSSFVLRGRACDST